VCDTLLPEAVLPSPKYQLTVPPEQPVTFTLNCFVAQTPLTVMALNGNELGGIGYVGHPDPGGQVCCITVIVLDVATQAPQVTTT